jgi:methionine-rich copper-binding protein CopC
MKLTPWFKPAAALMLLLVGAQPALPHASMIRASPPANGTVNAPREVSIMFSERIKPSQDAITVHDAKGVRVDRDDIRLDGNGRIVRASLQPLGPGTYRVTWRVQSSDSHTIQGTFTFRVR